MKTCLHRLVPIGSMILLAALTGCTAAQTAVRVQPWERGALAGYSLRPDRDALASAMSEHTYFSREASAAGRGVGGSGCGCN